MRSSNWLLIGCLVFAVELPRSPLANAQSATQASPALNPQFAMAMILNHFRTIENLSAEYLESVQSEPPPEDLKQIKHNPIPQPGPNGASFDIRTEPWERNCHYSFLKSAALCDAVMTAADIEYLKSRNTVGPVHEITAFDGKRSERMQIRPDAIMGDADNRLLFGSVLELSLGFRAEWDGQTGRLTPERLAKMGMRIDPDACCTLIENSDTAGPTLEFKFDSALQYAMVSVKLTVPSNSPSRLIPFEMTSSDFRDVDGVMLPFKMIDASFNNEGREVGRITETVSAYKLNDPDNQPERYHLKWPKGVEVADLTTHRIALTQTDGQILTEKDFMPLMTVRQMEADARDAAAATRQAR